MSRDSTQNDAASVLHSPILRAVWGGALPDDFASTQAKIPDASRNIIDACVGIVRGHKQAHTLHDENGKVREEVLDELGGAGYWGLLAPIESGGAGASFSAFTAMLTRMAKVDPTIAGLAAVHGCIGAMGAIQTFGSDEQKRRLLPRLARGETLGVFALTEPNAGSDLTALRTTARLEGNRYLVNGEKLFITNLALGRMLALVCLIDNKPAVLIAELPREADATFELREYGLWALKHTCNRGIEFRDFPVPRENLLVSPKGDGITIAYHGLNLGRTALCANAAGSLRIMLANMLPWVKFRETYGQPLANRELVQRRIGELASLIVGCDALAAWCAGLIDRGGRCEMECITAKVFASEALKHAAIELALKTHGGRAFLHGHPLGDHLYDYLAPLIYEGEGEILSLAFFRALVKPYGRVRLEAAKVPPQFSSLFESFDGHVKFAAAKLAELASEVDDAIRKFGAKLADRQCRIVELSRRCMDLTVILVASSYAATEDDDLTRTAAEMLCVRLASEIAGERPTVGYFQGVSALGEKIQENGFPRSLAAVPSEILMEYNYL